jgi:hypothetical protein
METSRLGLRDVYFILKTARREGAEKDEPEGARYIQISDTLANLMSLKIADILGEMGAEACESIPPTLGGD